MRLQWNSVALKPIELLRQVLQAWRHLVQDLLVVGVYPLDLLGAHDLYKAYEITCTYRGRKGKP